MNAIVTPERTAGRRVEGIRRRRGADLGGRGGPGGFRGFPGLVNALVGVALVAAAVYAQTFTMSLEDGVMPLTSKGAIGQSVTTTRFSARVDSVAAAHALKITDATGKPAEVATDALFLVVKVSATVPKEPIKLAKLTPPVLLTPDGRRFNPTDKVDESLTFFSKWIQPGWWSSGVLVYEVPRDALEGAKFVFLPPTGVIVVDALLPEAEIDLGLDGAAADRLAARAAASLPLTGAGG
jgi:hypothetical protein